jgi:hypothetical protein
MWTPSSSSLLLCAIHVEGTKLQHSRAEHLDALKSESSATVMVLGHAISQAVIRLLLTAATQVPGQILWDL